MALSPQNDEEWMAMQRLLHDMRNPTPQAPFTPAHRSVIPRRPWVLSRQYGMTFVLSQNNEIIIGSKGCEYLGDGVLRHIIEAVNAYAPEQRDQR